MLWGYFTSAWKGVPRYGDVEFRSFLRRYQHRSLLVGKAAAARRATEERRHVWLANHGTPEAAELPAAGVLVRDAN
jgi:hypothetical protein